MEIGRPARAPSADPHRGRPPGAGDLGFFPVRAGRFDVAFCSGPGPDLAACPLLHDQPCPVLTGADAVLHGLEPRLGVATAIRRHRPELPVVAFQRRRADGSLPPGPRGCIPHVFPSSVKGQIDALWQAILTRPDHGDSGQGDGASEPAKSRQMTSR
jgi:hypothetical protein